VSSISDWYFFGPGNTKTNYGSYAYNGWLYRLTGEVTPPFFMTTGNIKRPWKTPLFADALSHDALVQPTDPPSHNLYFTPITNLGNMQSFTIARHGGRAPKAAPQQIDTTQRLPGRINMVLYDGHVEQVPLDNLWNYYWSATWQVPKPRPH
jgi:prepilin-type processing-associated H-X9-DG protein